MRLWPGLALLSAVLLASSSTAQAEVHLVIRNGHVDLDAKNATIREILSEWARVGQTRIVNGEGVTGGPVTLQLNNVPEAQALEIVLRSVSGYMTAPRPVEIANASHFDRILVMPTSTPPKAAPPAQQPAFQPTPTFGPPGAMPIPADDQDDEQPPPGSQPFPGANGRGAVFPQNPNAPGQAPVAPRGPVYRPQQAPFPQPAYPPGANPNLPPGFQLQPPPQAAPQTAPPSGVMPVGVSTPGMVVQPPPQTAQPGAPQN